MTPAHQSRETVSQTQGIRRMFLGFLTATCLVPLTLGAYSSTAADARILALTRQVAALEREMAALQLTGSRVKAPFEVVDASGRAILTIEAAAENGATVMIGAAASGGVRLGVGASGAGFINVRRPDGVIAASIGQYKGGPMGLQVFNAEGAGAEPIAQLSAGENDKGELVVGQTSGGGVTLALGASFAGLLKARRADGSVGTSIGQYKGSAMGVQVFSTAGAGSDPIVELSADAAGGGKLAVADSATKGMFQVAESVKLSDAVVTIGRPLGRNAVTVATAKGTLLATLGEAGNGAGAVAAHSPAGQLRAVMNGLNGEIHIIDGSGSSRATMASNGAEAAFTIRSAGGTTIARLGEGQRGGWLQLANAGGFATVEAGIHPSGVGLVRALPVGSPGHGFVGMPGTFLLGRPGQQ